MKDWYLRQSQRDRMIVLVVGALVLAGLAYALIVHPLRTGLQTRQQNVNNANETLQYMREGQARIRASSGGGPVQKTSNKPPYLLIDEIIRKAGIELPERVEPAGSNGARVQFSEVEFDKLVLVIAELEQYGLQVSTLNISSKSAGRVSARFSMEKS